MKEIKILHLFPRLLNLYGEYANVSVLKYYLEKNGISVHVDMCDGAPEDLEKYDMVYISSGTEENIVYAAKVLSPFRDRIAGSIEKGTQWLCCGNALAVFGKEIIDSEKVCHEALNIFPFSSNEEKSRFSGDVLAKSKYADSLIGYVNNSYRFEGISTPFSELLLNRQLGNDKKNPEEGLEYKNFIASTLTGPLLVKNPHLTEILTERLVGERVCIPEEDNIKKAYRQTMKHMASRAEQTAKN